jgi:nucleoid-associated protein YgaU
MPKASALAVAKTLDEVEPLIFVKDDVEAKRLLVAWTLYQPNFTDSDLHEDTPPKTALALLWVDQEPVDYDRLGQIAGLPYLTTRKLFQRLTLAHLVYPDGSISKNARIIIQAEMRGYLMTLPTPQTQPDQQPTSPPRPKQSPRAAARAS